MAKTVTLEIQELTGTLAPMMTKAEVSSKSIYSPLLKSRSSRANTTTRLFKILQGGTQYLVLCALKVVDVESHPRFKGTFVRLGYPSPPDTMIGNGQPISVTRNLGSALKRLRPPYVDRVVWIDATCLYLDRYQTKDPDNLRLGPLFPQVALTWRAAKPAHLSTSRCISSL